MRTPDRQIKDMRKRPYLLCFAFGFDEGVPIYDLKGYFAQREDKPILFM